MSTYNTRTLEYKGYYEAGNKIPTLNTIKASTMGLLEGGTLMPVFPSSTDSTITANIIKPEEAGMWLRLNHASLTVYTIADGFAKDSIIMGVQSGAGQIQFTTASGGINNVSGYLSTTRATGAVFALINVGSNLWDLMGDLAVDPGA